ncbi:MAG TPA: hypothetical protein VFX59_05470 [Polyangiales bacterium]|nr:hypothetical protein [Polyangiales bacterium]
MHGKLLFGALTLLLGCSNAPTAPRPRGLQPGEETKAPVVVARPEPPPPPPPPSSLGSPFDKALDPGALQAPPPVVQDAGQPAQAAEVVVDASKPRDLSAELLERLGSPTSCLDLQQAVASGGRLNIVVVAEVMPSGRITRVQASAPGQPASALRCLENRASSAGLKGPVPGAPVSVTTTLPIEVASQPTQL